MVAVFVRRLGPPVALFVLLCPRLLQAQAVTGTLVGNLDASLAKWLSLKGDARTEFRIDAFNLTNRTQYQNPNGEFGNPRFGQITTTRADTERVVSFVLRIVF